MTELPNDTRRREQIEADQADITPEAGIEEMVEKFDEIVCAYHFCFMGPNEREDYRTLLRTTLHQARQTWLREEIGRLESEKVKTGGAPADVRFAMERHNQALQTIIDRYLLELDDIAQK